MLSLSGNGLTGADRGPPTAGRMDVVTVIVDGNPVLYTIQAGWALTIKTITGEVYSCYAYMFGHAMHACQVMPCMHGAIGGTIDDPIVTGL